MLAVCVEPLRKPQSENTIRESITEATGVNPHAFRSSMVTTIAINTPEQMHSVQMLAGHSPGSTVTTEHFNEACSYSASQDWNAIADAIRERGIKRMRERRHR